MFFPGMPHTLQSNRPAAATARIDLALLRIDALEMVDRLVTELPASIK